MVLSLKGIHVVLTHWAFCEILGLVVPSRELTSDSELGQVCSPAILGGTKHAKRLDQQRLRAASSRWSWCPGTALWIDSESSA